MGAIQTIRTIAGNFDELSNLIANPPADRPIAGAVANAGRALCNAYGNLNLGQQLLTGPGRPVVDLLCKPYFDGAGFDGPVSETPFQGGQCEAPYTLNQSAFTAVSTSCSQPEFSGTQNIAGGALLTNIPGPVTEVTKILDLNNACGPRRLSVRVVAQNYDQTVVITQTGSVDDFLESTPVSFTLSRQDGPDNCGDPPSTLVPGANPPPAPPPFAPGEEPGVNADGQPFFFVPDLQPPGSDPIPVDDEPIGGGPGGGPSNPSGGDGLPGSSDAIADEAGEVNGGDDGQEIDFGEPPEGRVWVGCIVETTTNSRIGNIPGTGPQSTVWPSVRGNVALKYGSKFGRSERINSRFFDLFRPNTSLILTGCFLQTQPGSTAKVFPISAITCPENPCAEN